MHILFKRKKFDEIKKRFINNFAESNINLRKIYLLKLDIYFHYMNIQFVKEQKWKGYLSFPILKFN